MANVALKNDQSFPALYSDKVIEQYRSGANPWRYPDVDWYDVMLDKLAPSYNASFDISGGSKRIKYYAMGSYYHDGSLIKQLNKNGPVKYTSDRINYRLNLDATLTKTTTLSLRFGGSVKINNRPNGSVTQGQIFNEMYMASGAMFPAYFTEDIYSLYPDPNYPDVEGIRVANNTGQNWENPARHLLYNNWREDTEYRVLSDLILKQNLNFITKGGLWRMTKLGIPISMQMCLEAASFNICAIFMGWIGAIPIAAHQIMCTISTFCFLLMYGIGAAAAVRISHFRGRGEWQQVRETAVAALALNACCSIITVTLICIFISPLTSVFTSNAEVATLVGSLLVPFVIYQAGDCLQIIYANALRGIESVKRMMLYAFVAYIVVSLPMSYIFAFVLDYGAVGVWYGIPFGLTTAGILFYREFDLQTRRMIK